jgi:hypothetical protein
MRLDAQHPFADRKHATAMQTPQGLDATHGDELFPVKREYVGNKLRSARGPLRRFKNSPLREAAFDLVFDEGGAAVKFRNCWKKRSDASDPAT